MEFSLHTDVDYANLMNHLDCNTFLYQATYNHVDIRGRNNHLSRNCYQVGRTLRPITGSVLINLLTGEGFVDKYNVHALGYSHCDFQRLNHLLVLTEFEKRQIVRCVYDALEESSMAVGSSTASFLFELNHTTFVCKFDITIHQNFQVNIRITVRVFNQQLDYTFGMNNLEGAFRKLGFI